MRKSASTLCLLHILHLSCESLIEKLKMGLSPSKSGSNKIEPVLSKSESWSTLDGFVASEAVIKSPETLAVNTTVNDEEIKQVKTWMNFPERKPKSTLNLDVHLSQSKHHKKIQLTGNSPGSEGASGLFLQGVIISNEK